MIVPTDRMIGRSTTISKFNKRVESLNLRFLTEIQFLFFVFSHRSLARFSSLVNDSIIKNTKLNKIYFYYVNEYCIFMHNKPDRFFAVPLAFHFLHKFVAFFPFLFFPRLFIGRNFEYIFLFERNHEPCSMCKLFIWNFISFFPIDMVLKWS